MQSKSDFWVGDRVVRPSLGEIRLGIERVRLEPRSMQVLLALADKAPEVVLKQELIDEVWGEKFVSDEVLTHAIWDLRRAFGDQATNPEFIQTIPKRGYRLIAPVKKIEPGGDEVAQNSAARPYLRHRALLGILALAILGGLAFGIGQRGPEDRFTAPGSAATVERASLSGRRPDPTTLKLTLLPALATDTPAIPPESLDQLRGLLAGMPAGIEVRKSETCSPPPGEGNEYCLTARLQRKGSSGYRASVQVEDTGSSRLAYSTAVDLGDLAELPTAGAQLAELVSTYLEIVRTWDVRDPDISPWISFRHHDVRAIRSFLHGRAMVLSHEVGARKPFQSAIEIDPGFVAPRVWRTPTLVSEADPEILTAHRDGLRDLYDDANPFEKTMISWAEAQIDNQLPEQLRQLEAALDQQPENRPVRVLLGATTYAFGDVDNAWAVLRPLLLEAWCYPPLYPLAATCALDRGQLEDARRALALALECEPVDPETLGLLLLSAVYDADTDAETLYAERLEQRKIEMLPEVVTVDLSRPAELLALQAETEDRKEIAARLREFAN